ncbi:MAG: alpha-ketoacid dehydrogenase subunit beta [Anaerolineales bacterium]|nr:alpha-ketoacid dehydrogenase subunit beta [Anaerolineales bacterium]MCK6581521.1 alpha-ketoacid dehydrogenase subunit beta [Anaerolineales bacterium]
MPEMTYLEAIRQALWQEMKRDESVFLIGEDIGVYGGAFGLTHGMLDEFGPERVRETPISEATIVATAVGASLLGMRPVAEIMFMDFVLLALDQIANQAAKMRFMFGGRTSVPIVVRMPGGSGTGAASQHSQSLESILMHFPGLKVVNPSTPYDAKGLMLASIRDPNPVCFVEHKALYKTKGDVPEDDYIIPIGVAEVKRAGRDLTVVANNIMVMKTLNVAKRLAQDGIEVEVIDPRTLLPLDTETIINSVVKTGRLLVVHEACQTGGWAGEVIASVVGSPAFDYIDAPVRRLGGKDIPIPYNRGLEKFAVPQEADIENEIRAMVGGAL